MIKLTDNHGARLLRMAPARVMPAIGDELEAGARLIAEDAAESIRADSISGPGHVPSLPGEPPNADTHDLDQSIHATDLVHVGNELRTAAVADSDHAWIERGGQNMEPRPYMEPAAERNRRAIIESVVERFRDTVLR